MRIRSPQLERFRLDGILGEGAELQAFAATDIETGTHVVIKRAHPTLISRSQHQFIEARLSKVIQLREEFDGFVRCLCPLVAYTDSERHDTYFGDSMTEQYTVLVEERAKGLPLVGSTVDAIKRMPIGLPQNIFALHPLVAHAEKGIFTIQRDVLELVEAFYQSGFLLLDLIPQNVFFDPLSAAVTVIDIGNVTVEQAATRRRDAIDLHNFYLEMFKWYVAPGEPPRSLKDYAAPSGMDSVAMFRQNLDSMVIEFAARSSDDLKAAVDILNNIRERKYPGLDDFRQDFEAYLSLVEKKYEKLSLDQELMDVWSQAANSLHDHHWHKFLFDPENDLRFYAARGR